MSRFTWRIRTLERHRVADGWGDHTDAWADLLQRHNAAGNGRIGDDELNITARQLAHTGPPPSLDELTARYRQRAP